MRSDLFHRRMHVMQDIDLETNEPLPSYQLWVWLFLQFARDGPRWKSSLFWDYAASFMGGPWVLAPPPEKEPEMTMEELNAQLRSLGLPPMD